MRQSLVYVAVMLVAITGCASRPVQIAEQTQREASVDQRMLAAQPPADGCGCRYHLCAGTDAAVSHAARIA